MSDEYVVGPTHAQSRHATVETKPTSVLSEYTRDGRRYARCDSGGGYERARSWEHRPHTPTQGKESVYAYVHRLCAVAWLYPEDMSVSEILEHLDGRDVHHNAPAEDKNWGVEWDNRESCLEVVEHGRHSEITQAAMRAFAEDDKKVAKGRIGGTDDDVCGLCGEVSDALATSPGFEGERCLECASDTSGGHPIEL